MGPTICLYKLLGNWGNDLFLVSHYPKNEKLKIQPAYRVNFYPFLTDPFLTNIQLNLHIPVCAVKPKL